MRGRGEERGGGRRERGGRGGGDGGKGGRRGRVREIREEMNTTRERKCG